MMRTYLLALVGLVLSLSTSCGGGGSSPATPPPDNSGGIKGPGTVTEGSSAEYRMERALSANSSYQWTINPTTAGNFANAKAQSTTFTAGAVTKDTPAEIRVAISSQSASAVSCSLAVTIKDKPQENNRPPIAAAQADPPIIQPGGYVQFRDGSVDPDSKEDIVKWEWDFTYDTSEGFKVDSDAKEPCVQYPNEGKYFVQLRVTDASGLSDMFDTPIQILVTTGDPGPVAKAIAYPNPGKVCEKIQFQNDGSYAQAGRSLVKYEWDWDSDGTYDQDGLFAEHSWNTPGNYNVQFRVTDDTGQISELSSPIAVVVENALPIADAYADKLDPSVGESVRFDGSNSYDPDCNGEVVAWEWDWENDGVFDSTGKTQDHMFDYPGIFPVTLRVTDDEGATALLGTPISITVSRGHTQTWGGLGHDSAYAVATDDLGNIYVTGEFSQTVDFDPNSTVNEVSSANSSSAFLSKFDPNGDFLWVTTWGSSDQNTGNDVVISTPGYIYVTGSSTVVKFNQNGQILWTYEDGKIGEGVAVDENYGVFVAGHFIPSGQSYPDAFLSNFTYDGALNWERIWGADDCDQSYDVALSSSGQPYVIGHFSGTVDLDPGTGEEIYQSADGSDSFLSKFSEYGELLWTRTWEATEAYGMTLDSADSIYITGYFEGATDFDPGPGVSSFDGSIGSYLSKFDSLGNFTWASAWTIYDPPPPPPNYGYDPGYSVTIGPSGEVLVAGAFAGTVDFDPSSSSTDYRYNGGAYLSRYSPDGQYEGVLTWGAHYSTDWDTAWSVTFDNAGRAVAAGDFVDSVDFNVDGQEIHTSNGDHDAFMMSIPSGFSW